MNNTFYFFNEKIAESITSEGKKLMRELLKNLNK